jgi:hypothetical protein
MKQKFIVVVLVCLIVLGSCEENYVLMESDGI